MTVRESYGAVTGRIEHDPTLRFTLYEQLDNKPVICHLDAGQEHLIERASNRLAIVSGCIERDGHTGTPLTVRDITDVRLFTEAEPGAWRKAMGVLEGTGRDEPAEVTIRRLRDAE